MQPGSSGNGIWVMSKKVTPPNRVLMRRCGPRITRCRACTFHNSKQPAHWHQLPFTQRYSRKTPTILIKDGAPRAPCGTWRGQKVEKSESFFHQQTLRTGTRRWNRKKCAPWNLLRKTPPRRSHSMFPYGPALLPLDPARQSTLYRVGSFRKGLRIWTPLLAS